MMEEVEQPLVSCIMPTKNRRRFVEQALRYFEVQDYPHKELIVIDDGDDLVVDLLAQHPLVRYYAPQHIHTVGAKRNFACEMAQGEIICHWDDDDWYSPQRLSYQVALLLNDQADITALHLRHVLDLQMMQGWRCEDGLEAQAGVTGMHYGTMMYRKSLWMYHARFQSSPKGDDGSGFVRKLIEQGARTWTLPCANHHTYVRHGHNIWKYQPGHSIGSEQWEQVSLEQCIGAIEDVRFYQFTGTYLQQKRGQQPVLSALLDYMNERPVRRIVPSLGSLVFAAIGRK
jgi:glycosyltransferase involved in cell wall biosynthesis